MATLRSFDEWSREGYRIRKGARHVARDPDTNAPLFSSAQVFQPWGWNDDDREDDAELADFYGIDGWGNN